MSEQPIDSFDNFLAQHKPVAKPELLHIGEVIDGWKILGFLGRGGCGEVYRVVSGNKLAALKILHKDGKAAKRRFNQECAVLGMVESTALVRPLARGRYYNGRPYLLTELLVPCPLPKHDDDLAEYLLRVCEGLSALHARGFVHRDIKPSNIMRRENGEVVVIDIGLAKDVAETAAPTNDVSIVDGKAVAVGTLSFGAPEQFQGGKVSPLSDVHALGRIIYAAFDGKVPRKWRGIVRRSTSSIPEERYGSVEEFAAAVRDRNRPRRFSIAAAIIVAALIAAMCVTTTPPSSWFTLFSEKLHWMSLCENVTLDRVEQQLLWERLETNNFNGTQFVSPIRAYRNITNRVRAVQIDLANQTNVFTHPIVLDSGRDYYFRGPGIFRADIIGGGHSVTVRLEKCIFENTTTRSLHDSGIVYLLENGAGLNFINLPRQDGFHQYIPSFDGAYNEVVFKGEETFSRKVWRKSPPSYEYKVEEQSQMDTQKQFRLDPDRIPTDAEVRLVAELFEVDIDEAERILESKQKERTSV